MKNKPSVVLLVYLLLALATLLSYWQVTRNAFVDFDDHRYIVDNPHVQQGLTCDGVVWAFSAGYAANWHPLTWISHMLDCQIYGLNPAGHHLTNLLLHLANTLLLFFLLRQWTGKLWRGAAVAALFALHPLHVESVAWASERKDVLSMLFFLLTLWAYSIYATAVNAGARAPLPQERAEPPAAEQQPHDDKDTARRAYGLALFFFAVGLMCKPMLVTLPCVMLLLDIWPLGRSELSGALSPRSLWPLVREKLPFFVLTVAASTVTYLVQRESVTSLEILPLSGRAANAAVAYIRYVLKTLWPADLAVIYPYPKHLPVLWLLSATLILAALSFCFVMRARRQPYLLVGWLWFLGMLVPTIGIVQVGAQAMADRYMYIPGIGLFILIVWGAGDLLGAWRYKREVLALAATAALAGCLVLTRMQVNYWRDTGTLFQHALEVTADNYIAYDGLGGFLDRTGRRDAALKLLFEAVRIRPNSPQAQYDLGTALMESGRLDEAIPHFKAALRGNPRFALAQNNLGTTLLKQGKLDEAARHFQLAADLNPQDPVACFNLGTVFLAQANAADAAMCFLRALRLKPDYVAAHSNLGVVLMRMGKRTEGIAHLAEAVRLNPNDSASQVNLGMALLELNQPGQAADHFCEAIRLQPDGANSHYYLALALIRQGDTNQAALQAQKARDLAQASGQRELAAQAEELLSSGKEKQQ